MKRFILLLTLGAAIFGQDTKPPQETSKDIEIKLLKLQLQEAAFIAQFDRDPVVVTLRAQQEATKKELEAKKKAEELEKARASAGK
jgi:3-dehydroquinate dehydratase